MHGSTVGRFNSSSLQIRQIHRCAKVKDKQLIQEMKETLRGHSKRQCSSEALMLAGRYFLFSGRTARSRQCLEKLLALFALTDLREADLTAKSPVSLRSVEALRMVGALGDRSQSAQWGSTDSGLSWLLQIVRSLHSSACMLQLQP